MPNDDRSAAEVVPLVREDIELGVRAVEGERVRIRTVVDREDLVFAGALKRGRVEIERVPMEKEVRAPPPDRREGGRYIISVTEERAVVVTKLFVVEEIHIIATSETEAVEVPASVRVMRAVVEREPRGAGAGEIADE